MIFTNRALLSSKSYSLKNIYLSISYKLLYSELYSTNSSLLL